MSLLDRFRPRWKHSDPQVRKVAVAELTDEAMLEEIFEKDVSADVRNAAFERLTDQHYLAQIAKGSSEHNVRAAGRITEQKILGDVACDALSPHVRMAAIAGLADDKVLQRIASLDMDPEVRASARQRHEGPDRIRDYLKNMLSKLHVAQEKAVRVAEFCGTLDDVCGALVANGRYRINGVVTDSSDATLGAGVTPDFSCIELLAGRKDADRVTTKDRVERVVYRIKIWRQGENDFSGAVEERRFEMSSNVVAWGDSSKSD